MYFVTYIYTTAKPTIQYLEYMLYMSRSVSTMIADMLRNKGVDLTEAEATILALGIHSDTGSLVYDSTVGLVFSWSTFGNAHLFVHSHACMPISLALHRRQKMRSC